jgi:hypothetical protein
MSNFYERFYTHDFHMDRLRRWDGPLKELTELLGVPGGKLLDVLEAAKDKNDKARISHAYVTGGTDAPECTRQAQEKPPKGQQKCDMEGHRATEKKRRKVDTDYRSIEKKTKCTGLPVFQARIALSTRAVERLEKLYSFTYFGRSEHKWPFSTRSWNTQKKFVSAHLLRYWVSTRTGPTAS